MKKENLIGIYFKYVLSTLVHVVDCITNLNIKFICKNYIVVENYPYNQIFRILWTQYSMCVCAVKPDFGSMSISSVLLVWEVDLKLRTNLRE